MSPQDVLKTLESLKARTRCEAEIEALELAIRAVTEMCFDSTPPPKPNVVFVPKRQRDAVPSPQRGQDQAALRFHRREDDDGLPY